MGKFMEKNFSASSMCQVCARCFIHFISFNVIPRNPEK